MHLQPIQTISIQDQLKHPGYHWPRTLIFEKVKLPVPDKENSQLMLLDEQGDTVPVQLINTVQDEDTIFAEAAFITDMPYRGEKHFDFHWEKHSDMPELGLSVADNADDIHIVTDQFTLIVNRSPQQNEDACKIFTIIHRESGITAETVLYTGKVLSECKASVLEQGQVFADVLITLEFEGKGCYSLRLRVVDTMDFLEMTEEMEGFAQDDETSLKLKWKQFAPDYRHCQYRDWEKIDEYMGTDSYIPFSILPFDSWISWWTTKAASFMDTHSGYSTGVFVKNADIWHNQRYALWRSPQSLAPRFQYVDDKILLFEYPVVSGCRSTAIAVYPNSCEGNVNLHAKLAADGLYGMRAEAPSACTHLQKEWFWQEFISFNKVKNWILRWDEQQSEYPRFFPEESIPEQGASVWYLGNCKRPFTPKQVEKVVYELSNSMNQLIITGAVSNREFFDWVIMFDMAIPKMTAKQFSDLKACFAFMAYALSDENYMPIGHMLAGHPNFLVDGHSASGLAAALFPTHPDAVQWKEHFERAMALNLKYHTRPSVEQWGSKGGRWTENLGCYVFAAFNPMIKAQALLNRSYGEHVLLYPNFRLVAQCLLDSLSAPVEGERTFSPMGAHSGQVCDPQIPSYIMSILADQLFCYDPLLAEYWRHVSNPNNREMEERAVGTYLYRYLAGKTYSDTIGTRPPLKSEKYTGLGYVLRSHVHEPDELSVHLLQIDDGPNYRWGRAAQGGCGNIWYYARGKRYSAQRPEDVGDWNKGDTQSCSNFGVLIGHEYKSVGRNELKEPLYDFGFAQYAQINASDEISPFYRSRSVILSGNDYLIVYDAVGDKQVHGRFSWFNKQGEPFPNIVQLKPGCGFVENNGGIPVDEPARVPDDCYTGRYYDGDGDFLTVVSHYGMNCDRMMYAAATDYGAKLELQGRTDLIFRSNAKIHYQDTACGFTGYAGIIRIYGDALAQAALFKGTSIKALGVEITIQGGASLPSAGLSFTIDQNNLRGIIQCQEDITLTLGCEFDSSSHRLFLNGMQTDVQCMDKRIGSVKVPKGKFTWEYTTRLPVPMKPVIEKTVISSGCVELWWSKSIGAEQYVIEKSEDCGENWDYVAETEQTSYSMEGLQNGTKFHIRVAGLNRDGQGSFCHDYPIYVSDQPPMKPDGLRVWKQRDNFAISWGRQLGVQEYRLYRRVRGEMDFQVLFIGENAAYTDCSGLSGLVYEYMVTAVNGNGESEKSNIRDNSLNGLAYWDPEPEIKFRRYIPSHEYGYRGFDHWESYAQGEAEPYPE